MTSPYDPLNPPWWVVRSVVDITVDGELADCEDRMVLIRADSEAQARSKGEQEAEKYGSTYLNAEGLTVTWAVRGISDVRGILDADVTDGTEVYSAFIGPDLAEILLAPPVAGLGGGESRQELQRCDGRRDSGVDH